MSGTPPLATGEMVVVYVRLAGRKTGWPAMLRVVFEGYSK